MATILIVVARSIIIINLIYFFTNRSYRESFFHLALFLKLFFILFALTIAFAVLYYGLSMNQVVLTHSDETGDPVLPIFGTCCITAV